MTLVEVEKIKSENRRLNNLNNQDVECPNLGTREIKGRTTQIIADKIGFKSGHEAARAIKTVEKIDELKQRGDDDSNEKAEIL